MQKVRLLARNDLAEWRAAARGLLLAGVPPEDVTWQDPDAPGDLFGDDAAPPTISGRTVGAVPERFIELAQAAICHRDPDRFGLLYRLLWRLQADRTLLAVRSDVDVRALESLASAVRRDAHKMKAFVRFKSVTDDSGLERFAAWFEPDHYVLEWVAPFFVRRFTGMIWAIVTPYASAMWDEEELVFGEGGRKADLPQADALEDTWRTYFASIFNPARLKVAMMKSEMPVKYWRNLPEAELIPSLIHDAARREEEMIAHAPTSPSTRHHKQARRRAELEPEAMEEITSLADARAAVQGCRRCPLYEHATQAVFGEGPAKAELMFVGEQPGDQEDIRGQPFVGPAGRLFDRVLADVGIDRQRTYVTNAVKHFKFVPRGKRRLHQRPNAGEINACRFWLNLEREFVKPRIIVALGATAAYGITGKNASITSQRGRPIALEDGTMLVVTVHPSFLLRVREGGEDEERKFKADLELARELLEEGQDDRPRRKAS